MDGSSIRGWAAIHESDMLLIPDPETALMDPFAETRRLIMIGDVQDPITKQRYERDPRWIARKAELYLTTAAWRTRRTSGPRRSSHLRQREFSTRTNTRDILYRRRGRALEFGAAGEQPGLPARYKEGYFRYRRRIIIRICAARWCRR